MSAFDAQVLRWISKADTVEADKKAQVLEKGMKSAARYMRRKSRKPSGPALQYAFGLHERMDTEKAKQQRLAREQRLKQQLPQQQLQARETPQHAGVAWLRSDGTLRLQLHTPHLPPAALRFARSKLLPVRAEGLIERGGVLILEYSPDTEGYTPMRDHLKGLEFGRSCPVPPFQDWPYRPAGDQRDAIEEEEEELPCTSISTLGALKVESIGSEASSSVPEEVFSAGGAGLGRWEAGAAASAAVAAAVADEHSDTDSDFLSATLSTNNYSVQSLLPNITVRSGVSDYMDRDATLPQGRSGIPTLTIPQPSFAGGSRKSTPDPSPRTREQNCQELDKLQKLLWQVQE